MGYSENSFLLFHELIEHFLELFIDLVIICIFFVYLLICEAKSCLELFSGFIVWKI